jgi:hypothetical protein
MIGIFFKWMGLIIAGVIFAGWAPITIPLAIGVAIFFFVLRPKDWK